MEQIIETSSDSEVKAKMHYTGKVLKTSLAGALIEYGAEKPGLLHISQMISADDQPIMRVEDVLQIGKEVEVWVKKIKDGRVELTMIKPLDLEWRDLKKDMVVKGTVVRLEKFGAFVEIGAERPGLIHISEMAHGYVKNASDVVKEGDEVEAQVIDVNRKKKQIKLSIKALTPEPVKEEEPRFSEPQPRREKAVKRPKKVTTRRERGAGDEDNSALLEVNAGGSGEAEPTAMQMAWQEAMERAKDRKKLQEEKKKAKANSREQEDLLSRTLENKVQTA